ncbi:hypothetical protein C8Q80DRAFT_1103639 [Daedaleopsis nitida]|nr:hypothetical protein C8Q80DRAFT_1103639 [Daedaleopsis nitida]
MILIYAEPEQVGDIEEVVLNLQGYLLNATLPPIRQHNLPRNHNRLIDLKQSVTLTGLGSEQFHAGVRGVGAMYHAFKMYLGSRGSHIRTWAPGCDAGESLTLAFSNRILTPAKNAEGKREFSLENMVDPFNILRPLLCSEVHTLENHVEYWNRTLHRRNNIESSPFERYKPEFFNLSNMVEVQVSFQAIRVARHDYIFIPKLRAICLLHRTAEGVYTHHLLSFLQPMLMYASPTNDYNIAAIEAIARGPVSPMKKVKRKVGYGCSDDDGSEEDVSSPTAMKHLHLDDVDNSHNQVMRVSST